jgi:hypothetical protein
VSANKTNISQIGKYLNGELDARAMHKLEHEAQDDPFLMDALEGYAIGNEDQQANIDDLKERLVKRIAPKEERSLVLWRILPIAVSLLLMVGIGYWAFSPKPIIKQYATVILPQKTTKQSDKLKLAEPQIASVQKTTPSKLPALPALRQHKTTVVIPAANGLASIAITGDKNKITYKTDTVEYQATVKSLPADIIEKIQVGDDYGDPSAKPGTKTGVTTKVLDITTDTFNKQNLIAANSVNGHKPDLKEVMIRRYSTQQKREVAASMATINIDQSKKQPDTTLNNALSEKVAGVAVTENGTRFGQDRTITGRVTAKDDGQPIPGVTIKVNVGNQVVQTNTNGEFEMTVPANESTLNVAYIGYLAQSVKISKQDNLKIELTASTQSLSEVVVVGYGTQNKKTTPIEAEPVSGWKDYNAYISNAALMPDGSTGNVKLGFNVAVDGSISNIHVIAGKDSAMNKAAINILQNGPKWIRGSTTKEVTLKIKFHKKG